MPAPLSGLSAQLALATEATYGTAPAVGSFQPIEFTSESLKLDRNYIMSRQLKAGRSFQQSARRVPTTKAVAGAVSLEVPTKGFGRWLNLLHDNVVTPTGAGAAKTQTHLIGTKPSTKSASIQVGRPSTDGVVNPFTYTGAVATGWSLSCDVGGFLTASWTFDGQDEKLTGDTGAVALIAATGYPANVAGFDFSQGVLQIGGSTVANIRSFGLTGGTGFKVDRYFFGTNGLKQQPIANDYSSGDLTLGAEFDGLTQYNRFRSGAVASVRLTFTGAAISGGGNYTFDINMPCVGFNGETPNVDGPDVLDLSLPCVVLDDGTTNSPITITYTTDDTAL